MTHRVAKSDGTKVVGVRFRPSLVAEIVAIAERDGEDFSTTVRRLIRLGLLHERRAIDNRA
jgi:hypothetical protein